MTINIIPEINKLLQYFLILKHYDLEYQKSWLVISTDATRWIVIIQFNIFYFELKK